MRWNWMAIWIMAAVLAAAPIAGLGQGAATGSAVDFEDRLLRAELLEVSAGEVQQAMETYRALAADPAAPAPVVARALLYQARCLRKLGQLAEARTVLEDLVETHAAERDITPQATQFLRELRTGTAENPAFDWLHEMEDNPEIQARVFDLVMDLANLERASAAHRQLLALGPIAYPVMDRMIRTSRDPAQRDLLAPAFLQQSTIRDRPSISPSPNPEVPIDSENRDRSGISTKPTDSTGLIDKYPATAQRPLPPAHENSPIGKRQVESPVQPHQRRREPTHGTNTL